MIINKDNNGKPIGFIETLISNERHRGVSDPADRREGTSQWTPTSRWNALVFSIIFQLPVDYSRVELPTSRDRTLGVCLGWTLCVPLT